KLLHLTRYPRPRPPHVALAEGMLSALRAARDRGGAAYPLPFDKLLERTPGADPKLVAKAVAEPAFRQSVVAAVKKQAAAPVALAEDAGLLAGSALLLETALRLARTD